MPRPVGFVRCVSRGQAGVLATSHQGTSRPPSWRRRRRPGPWAQGSLSGHSSRAPPWRLSLEKARTYGREVLSWLLDREVSTSCSVCFCLRDVSLVLFISSVCTHVSTDSGLLIYTGCDLMVHDVSHSSGQQAPSQRLLSPSDKPSSQRGFCL